MIRFKNRFRIDSARLKEWDYSNPWWYYVTINTKNHISFWGKVENGKMILNELGKIVDNEWNRTKLIRKNVDLDYYVIMPNHIHGIIILNQVETRRGVSPKEKQLNSQTRYGESLHALDRSQFGLPIKNSLSVIINQFKGSVKRWANKNGYSNFAWQSRFYDRIIRNEKELFFIRRYIEHNPMKWELERNSTENIYDL